MKISVDTFCKRNRETAGQRERETEGKRDGENPRRSISHSLILSISLTLCLSVFLAACGKIGGPLPPLRRDPLRVEGLGVEQRGAHLILSFPFTRETRTKLQRIDVYRLIEPPDTPMGVPIETFSERASVVYSILADDVPGGSSNVLYADALNVKNDGESRRYRYAVRTFHTDGQATEFSNYAVIEPLFNLALPPARLAAEQVEKQIEITWEPPEGNINETEPAQVAGYNIYRRQGGSFVKINSYPLQEPHFADRDFQFSADYQYVVRSLSFKPGSASLSESVESDDSQPLRYTPKDIFPPAPPESITIASINSIVSLFWPLSPEPDAIGYNIYRAEDENAPPEKWVKINPEPHKTASFRDDHGQVGKKYFYQITAVDAYGNESARSETVSETVVR